VVGVGEQKLGTYLDVNVVPNFVGFHECGQVDHAVFSELAREHVSRSAAITFRFGHFGLFFESFWKIEEKFHEFFDSTKNVSV
jgi:hypothetical protein